MLALAALLLAAPLPAAPDTVPRADAYLDAAAREWIAGARARQRERDRSVASYTATVRERAWAGLRTLGRDRTLGSLRTAARVEWNRDGAARVTITGSRTMGPDGEVEVMGPTDTGPAAFAYDPADDPLVIRLADSAWVRHPLAPGSEAFYRFRTGPLTSISLPGGRAVRVVEIQVEPRRDDPRLLRGSLWLDADTRAPVRILFRPAAPLVAKLGGGISTSGGRRNLSLGARVGEGGRGWLGSAEAEVRYVTVEYGLYGGRWWMLRSLALEGVARAKALGISAAIPVRWERAYSDYRVQGTAPGATVAAVVPLDTATASHPGRSCPAKRPDGAGCRCRAELCRIIQVQVPPDTAALLASAELPPSFAEEGERTLAGTDIDDLVDALERRLPPVWALRSPRVGWIPPSPGTLRYNRVEGLSVGAGIDADFGPVAADLRVRLGTADREPNAEIGLTRQGGRSALRLAGYRRLDRVDPASRPFGLGNSLAALLWGRDTGDYFRTIGAELIGGPPPTERPWYEWRLFAERQSAAERHTDFSLWNTLGGGDFRPNIVADRANQAGASLALRRSWEGRTGGPRAGAELWTEASTGTFGFARPRLQLSGGVPLPGGLWGSLEAAAGSSAGQLPTQSLWYLGGPATLRGYDGGAVRGNSFWRARGELATAGPVTRLGVFADAGWAGNRGAFGAGRTLASVGVGASLLDGWLRLDVARALVAPTGWGVYLSVEPAR